MFAIVSQFLPQFPLFLVVAVTTHLAISFAQTWMRRSLGHHRLGGKLFRNHISFHHSYYSKGYLVSRT